MPNIRVFPSVWRKEPAAAPGISATLTTSWRRACNHDGSVVTLAVAYIKDIHDSTGRLTTSAEGRPHGGSAAMLAPWLHQSYHICRRCRVPGTWSLEARQSGARRRAPVWSRLADESAIHLQHFWLIGEEKVAATTAPRSIMTPPVSSYHGEKVAGGAIDPIEGTERIDGRTVPAASYCCTPVVAPRRPDE